MAEFDVSGSPLATDRLLLHPWRQPDLPTLLAEFIDRVVPPFDNPDVRRALNEADACNYLIKQERARIRGEELQWALVPPTNEGALLGGASIYNVDLGEARAAVGY
jgi:hypothetical protein